MQQTLSSNDKNLKCLRKLIANGYYNGYVGLESFVLSPNRMPSNTKIIGKQTSHGVYDLEFSLIFLNKRSTKAILYLGIIGMLWSFFYNWGIVTVIALLLVLMFWHFKYREKKEMTYFLERLFDCRRTYYPNNKNIF